MAKEIVDCFIQKDIMAAKEKYHEVYKPYTKKIAFAIKSFLKREPALKAYNLIGLWAGIHTRPSEKKIKADLYIKCISLERKNNPSAYITNYLILPILLYPNSCIELPLPNAQL